MPNRHLLIAVITIIAYSSTARAVELTLTDAHVAVDDIQVSQTGSSVTVSDGSSPRRSMPKQQLAGEENIVAFPDLTRRGRKPKTSEPRPQLVSETEFSAGQIGTGLDGLTFEDESPEYDSVRLCGCPSTEDCSCAAGEYEVISGGEIIGGCSENCVGGCGPGCSGTKGIVLDFWLAQGFNWNPDDPANGSNLPVTFNDRANEYQLNQLYLALGREVGTGGSWDIGGRVDLLFGTDYFFTQAAGLEINTDGTPHWNSSNGPRRAAGTGAAMYGLAMPQAYLEFFAPLGPGIKFKFGHFYTAIGYESVMAPENFFYSHAYTMQYGEPFTHTGMLAELALSRRFDILAGFTRGWDNWEDPNGQLGFLGGFAWTAPSEMASVALTVTSSNEDAAGQNNRTVYSLVYTRRLGCRLNYILQHDFGIEELGEVGQNGTNEVAKWYGINNYLTFDVTDKFSLGLRAEWFRDQDNARVLALPVESLVQGGNYFGLTAGTNWKIRPRWTFRKEIRWDWSDVEVPSLGRNGMYNDFTEDNQLTLSTDLIFRF